MEEKEKKLYYSDNKLWQIQKGKFGPEGLLNEGKMTVYSPEGNICEIAKGKFVTINKKNLLD